MIGATVSSMSCFCWLYRASPSLAAKNIINLISVLTIWWCSCVESSLVLLGEGVCYDQCVQSCPTLCDPRDCSLPGSPVPGIPQARILKWVAISSCRRSSRPRDGTRLYRLLHWQAELFTLVPPGKLYIIWAEISWKICLQIEEKSVKKKVKNFG